MAGVPAVVEAIRRRSRPRRACGATPRSGPRNGWRSSSSPRISPARASSASSTQSPSDPVGRRSNRLSSPANTASGSARFHREASATRARRASARRSSSSRPKVRLDIRARFVHPPSLPRFRHRLAPRPRHRHGSSGRRAGGPAVSQLGPGTGSKLFTAALPGRRRRRLAAVSEGDGWRGPAGLFPGRPRSPSQRRKPSSN